MHPLSPPALWEILPWAAVPEGQEKEQSLAGGLTQTLAEIHYQWIAAAQTMSAQKAIGWASS